MKKHAIIPIFIPHRGCQNDCVFCNQKIITARSNDVTPKDVRNIIEEYLPTLKNRDLKMIEIAFFGGSFTGIPMEDQKTFLSVAHEYKKSGYIDKIHLSTRPDYINEEILNQLKYYDTDIIELGVQSFDSHVLKSCKRGHTLDDVHNACDLIKEYGFTLGIQLMIGLPGDNKIKAIASAKETVKLNPQVARLYPTVVLPDTQLAIMCKEHSYHPLTETEAVDITTEMYKILIEANITILRVGLKSTGLITNDTDLGGSYHPAFRQLVEGRIALEKIEDILGKMNLCNINAITFFSNDRCFSAMIGHKACNKNFLEKKYEKIKISWKSNNNLKDNEYCVRI